MYKIDLDSKKLLKIDTTILKNENLLERNDLQQFIFNSWESFKNDIGLPGAILLGQEIKPHDSVQDSIDLLALDQNDSSLIVIELKRDKNKLQLLQALSYAAMAATWDSEKLISTLNKKEEISNEALDLIKTNEFNKEVKIVMIAEYFDPEVIITSDWLSSNYGVNISIFSIELHKVENKLLFDIDQKYPLPELSETYEARRKKINDSKTTQDISWDDIIPNLKYDFAEKGINICKKIKEGDPKRRRFGDIVKNYEGFNWISFNFREKYLNVYTGCDDKNACKKNISSILGNDIDISEWRDGISFNISKSSDFDKIIEWLKI
jgi:hypothetical protein